MGRLQMTLAVVCICFFIGIITGAVSERGLSTEQATKLSTYWGICGNENTDFSRLFIKHGKYIIAMWLSGFVLPGSIIILIIIFTTGIFYGFSAAFAAQSKGITYVLTNIFPQNALLIPLYIFTAVWTIMYVLKKYSNNGPKSRIRQERRKTLTEHTVILGVCLLCNSAVCIVEICIERFLTNFLN
ncbi:hypothetical protein SDC9_81804 [bioreactor metagenome]|uniref:Stage II sporulation protein M n=1 Tax=bioreactor metagenome TaxID=1076179 RepID=A0A644ZBE6_9ZZZZ